MRMLGIDHGHARIGLAVCDELGISITPLPIVKHQSRAKDAQRIANIASEQQAQKIIIGVPLNAAGEDTHQSRSIRRFGAVLAELTSIPIAYWDETGSTKRAEALLSLGKKKNAASDSIAAGIILRDYLDAHQAPY